MGKYRSDIRTYTHVIHEIHQVSNTRMLFLSLISINGMIAYQIYRDVSDSPSRE